jgi:hypothetical protein
VFEGLGASQSSERGTGLPSLSFAAANPTDLFLLRRHHSIEKSFAGRRTNPLRGRFVRGGLGAWIWVDCDFD